MFKKHGCALTVQRRLSLRERAAGEVVRLFVCLETPASKIPAHY